MSGTISLSNNDLGLGLMGMTWRPEPISVDEAVKVLRASVAAGCTLWNGAEFYGTSDYNSMHLLKAYFSQFPNDAPKVTLMIKGGVNPVTIRPDGSPEGIRQSIDNILDGLKGISNLKVIFCIARRDHSQPFDVTLQTIQNEYLNSGKLAGVAISECGKDTIEEAAKHVKVAAVEVELSMFTPDVFKNGVAETCKNHNIPIVAYSPIGRGLLAGQIRQASDAQHLGRISGFPRLQDEAIQHNLKLTDQVEALAKKKGCTAAQLAVNWVRALGKRSSMPAIIPIPGSTTVARMEENSQVIDLEEEEMEAIDKLINNFDVYGRRYPDGVPVEL